MKALIITSRLVQDHEFIYPFYRLKEEGLEVDVYNQSDQIVNGGRWRSDNCYDFFGVGKLPWDEEERYLSEDYYFSRLWSKIGGKIWADVASPLVHHGNMHFKGHVGTIFSVANDINKGKSKTGHSETD